MSLMTLEEKKQILTRAVSICKMHDITFSVNDWTKKKLKLTYFDDDKKTIRAICQMEYEGFFLVSHEFHKALQPSAVFCGECEQLCGCDVIKKDDDPELVSMCCKVPVTWLDNWKKFLEKMAVQEDRVSFLRDYLIQAGIGLGNPVKEGEAW